MSLRKKFVLTATTFCPKGRVIAHAQNQVTKTHPLQKHFAIKAGESELKCVTHAEIGAILKSRGKQIDSILVQRFAANGAPALAMPCKSCQEAIKAFGIRLVRYTTVTGVKTYFV